MTVTPSAAFIKVIGGINKLQETTTDRKKHMALQIIIDTLVDFQRDHDPLFERDYTSIFTRLTTYLINRA